MGRLAFYECNRIISYHIISYHIISYHIISYHIISYHIIKINLRISPSDHVVKIPMLGYHRVQNLPYGFFVDSWVTLELEIRFKDLHMHALCIQQLQLAGITPTGSARDSAQTMPGTTVRTNEATKRPGAPERVLKKHSAICTAQAHLYCSSGWTVSIDQANTRVFGIVLTSSCLKPFKN